MCTIIYEQLSREYLTHDGIVMFAQCTLHLDLQEGRARSSVKNIDLINDSGKRTITINRS